MTARLAPSPVMRRCVRCGYTKTYRTAGMAGHHFAQHSCAKHQRAAETTARGRARMARIDRTPKTCTHPQTHHQHGTYACYVLDFCRCYPCAAAQSTYETNRVRQHAYGRWNNLVDVKPVRAHLRELQAQGLGLKRAAEVAGVTQSVAGSILYGKPRSDGSTRPLLRVRRETAEKLLGVRFDPAHLAGGTPVSALGTHRRVQALVVLGWSQSKIAAELGVSRGNFGAMMSRDQVTAATARRMAEIFEAWWDAAPPQDSHRDKIAASRSRRYAAQRGWAPPMAWDADALDSPDGQPNTDEVTDTELDEIAVLRIMAGTLHLPTHTRSPERLEAIRRMASRGLSDALIGNYIGMSKDAVCQTRLRNQIPSSPSDSAGVNRNAYGPPLHPAQQIAAIAAGRTTPSEGDAPAPTGRSIPA